MTGRREGRGGQGGESGSGERKGHGGRAEECGGGCMLGRERRGEAGRKRSVLECCQRDTRAEGGRRGHTNERRLARLQARRPHQEPACWKESKLTKKVPPRCGLFLKARR